MQNQLRVHCNPEQGNAGFITGFPFNNGFENVTTLDGAGGVPASFITLGTVVHDSGSHLLSIIFCYSNQGGLDYIFKNLFCKKMEMINKIYYKNIFLDFHVAFKIYGAPNLWTVMQ